MALVWEQVTVDALEPRVLGQWWARALGWCTVDDDDDVYEIRAAPQVLPGILFVRVGDRRVVKNRLHLDFRPDDQAQEVGRLLDLGATRVDVGQGDATWVVLADPEGNEFCVLRSASE